MDQSMIKHRSNLAASLAIAGLLALGAASAPAAAASSPSVTVSAFYDTLTTAMKDGPSIGFQGRRDRMVPAVQSAFDLGQMMRLMVGPQWQTLSPSQQQQLTAAFTAYSAATYASRFAKYSGQRFDVDPKAVAGNDGTIVHTKLVRPDGDPVELDYLMKSSGGDWKIVDVFLSGTISELATRRSEFSAVMSRGGPQALVEALRQKAAAPQG
jgi:phospholipid transport system substrate-binding protein